VTAHSTAAAAVSSTASSVTGPNPPSAYFVPVTAPPHNSAASIKAIKGLFIPRAPSPFSPCPQWKRVAPAP